MAGFRKLYQRLLLDLTLHRFGNAFRLLPHCYFSNFDIAGLSTGLIGLIVFFRPSRLNYSLLWIVVVSSGFAIGYASSDAFLYLIPAFLCFAIWIGMV